MAFRIVIVGGGIAGFTAAIALRAPNRIITVLEQSRLNKEIGALISLQPNASRIVESEWGLRNELHGEAKAIVDEGFRIYNTEGHLVNSLPLTTRTEYGADRLCFHRRDLHDTLKKAAVSPDRVGDSVVLRTACKVTDCDPLKGSVTLEDGETITGDLIIGADGMYVALHRCSTYNFAKIDDHTDTAWCESMFCLIQSRQHFQRVYQVSHYSFRSTRYPRLTLETRTSLSSHGLSFLSPSCCTMYFIHLTNSNEDLHRHTRKGRTRVLLKD